jgi:hypothetical protein
LTVQMEESGVLSGASGHEQWRIMERVQMYRRTVVQLYRHTEVQTNVAIERMVAVSFTKRDPSLNY